MATLTPLRSASINPVVENAKKISPDSVPPLPPTFASPNAARFGDTLQLVWQQRCVGRWFNVEALYQESHNGQRDGSISVWQDGQLILSVNNVKTVLAGDVIWGIGNYTDHITGGTKNGSATIFFDDATVATKPTHSYLDQILKKRQK